MNYSLVQYKIDRGIGKAALRLGPPFTGYRVEAGSAGDFPGGWSTLVTGFPIYRERVADPALETGIKNVTLFYNIYADFSLYDLGDVFLCTDPPLDPGVSYGPNATSIPGTEEILALSLAWHQPARIPTGARLTHKAAIYRPATGPLTLPDGSKYWASQHDNDQPLVLTSGTFAFGVAGSGAGSVVPVGLAAYYRPYGSEPFGSPPPPGMLRPPLYFIYVPPLPGYIPREGDAIITVDDARYVVVNGYEQQTGVCGYQLVAERTAAPNS